MATRISARTALWTIIGVSALLRLVLAGSLEAFTNESYYYLYAKNLDWGYFDHPPMTGLVAALGLKLAGGISPEFGLRLGFILMFAGSTWLLARLTTRFFGARAGVIAALCLNATVFYGLITSTMASPDGPLLFFWLLTLDRLAAAFDQPDRKSIWIAAGMALGGAMLCKYYAVLLPAGAALYMLLRPATWQCLRKLGPYLALAVSLIVFSPVILWNATHEWASFAYQSGRASESKGFHPNMFLEAMTAQVLFLTPWIFLTLLIVVIRLCRRRFREWSDAEVFLCCQAAPALTLFLGLSAFQRIMPHWPMIGFVALMPLLGRNLADRLSILQSWRRPIVVGTLMAGVPFVIAAFVVLHAQTGFLGGSGGRVLGFIEPKSDPTIDLIRWGQIAKDLRNRGLLDDPKVFLFTDHWRNSAQLAMAARLPSRTACYTKDDRSFRLWSRSEDYVGRDGIYVDVIDGESDSYDYGPWFTGIEFLGEIPIVRAGITMEKVRLFRCNSQTAPFRFGWAGTERVPKPNEELARQISKTITR